jgi:hypothetical protein
MHRVWLLQAMGLWRSAAMAFAAPAAAAFLLGRSGLLAVAVGAMLLRVGFRVRRLGFIDVFGFLLLNRFRHIGWRGHAHFGGDDRFLRRGWFDKFSGRALEIECSGNQIVLRLEADRHAIVGFDTSEFAAFLVERVKRDFVRNLHDDRR